MTKLKACSLKYEKPGSWSWTGHASQQFSHSLWVSFCSSLMDRMPTLTASRDCGESPHQNIKCYNRRILRRVLSNGWWERMKNVWGKESTIWRHKGLLKDLYIPEIKMKAGLCESVWWEATWHNCRTCKTGGSWFQRCHLWAGWLQKSPFSSLSFLIYSMGIIFGPAYFLKSSLDQIKSLFLKV